MKIAICAGHHNDAKGAVNSKHGRNEHDEALIVLVHLRDLLLAGGHDVSVFSGTLHRKISNINHGNFDMAVDVHFNAGGGYGCEVVHVPNSTRRKAQAGAMSAAIGLLLGVHDRGAKDGWYMGGSKPGTKPDAFVAQTNCPAFIPEPFFIDDDVAVEKWLVGYRHYQIAEAIAMGINDAHLIT